MARQRSTVFTTIRTEGGLLPADLLAGVAAQDRGVPGISAGDYHLVKGEQLGNRITESWNRVSLAWKDVTARLAALPEDDPGTTVVRERWMLPLFNELGYGRLQTARAIEVDGKAFAVSHSWGNSPIHLVGARVPLDRRTAGVKGAAGASPHSLVQELLNRSDEHLWAFVSNGMRLRVLRDNASLTRQAYVEFDLETMFADEVFDDFVVLWLTCHQSRVEAENPTECWLEQWTKVAAEAGTRARDDLRSGVEAAIEALGAGFVSHPANTVLRERLRTGDLSTHDLYRQLLRLIYRLLFLFVAEDRNLLHPPAATDEQRRRYARYYGLARIRTLAGRRRGGPHPDLWDSLVVVFTGLGNTDGIPALGLPALGSFLWSAAACPDLDAARIANQALLTAVRGVAFMEDATEKVLRPVDYRNLGSEELGAIYESLLEQHTVVNADAGTFALNTAAGNERKTTGSYYTPTSLITELLDSSVDPVVAEAAANPNPEEAILDLKVIDPACGSGHFLIAAAHRIAKRLAAIRTGDDEPSPDATRTALRDVIARCIHGIDLNPMAVELCKVSLWMESMEPGKPLGFLDHRIVRGNGLIGATPTMLDAGVPDDAFKPLTGDDKAVIASLKKRNKSARTGQGNLFGTANTIELSAIAGAVDAIDAAPDTDLHAVQTKAARWNELVESPDYQALVHAADTWCAAFVAPKTATDPGITHEDYATARDNPASVAPQVRSVVQSLADQYAFLHWHLAFPDAFGGRGGFDVILGNPPWEQVQYDPKEVFAASHPEISKAPTMAKRNKMIADMESSSPEDFERHLRALREVEAFQNFAHSSSLYPLSSVGRLNTAPLFLERAIQSLAGAGRLGMIVPSGIATDSFTQDFFRYLVETRRLNSFFDFENAVGLFPGVGHGRLKFCLLTVTGAERQNSNTTFVFFAHHVSDIHDESKRFTLTPQDFSLLNPNSKTAPVFRTRRDADLTSDIYMRLPVLRRVSDPDAAGWKFNVQLMFMMNEASHLFHGATDLASRGGLRKGAEWRVDETRFVPLYEAKMIHHFNHRFGDYEMRLGHERGNNLPSPTITMLADPSHIVHPRHWISADELAARDRNGDRGWFFGYRDICRSTDERTAIASILPYAAVGATIRVINCNALTAVLLNGIFASFAFDYVARQKIGGTHLSLGYFEQLAVPAAASLLESPWASEFVHSRVLELTYTSWDLARFSADVGWAGPPFRWDPERRELLRAELDAAVFHFYGIERDDVDYIMDAFPIVRRKDEAEHGEYYTKRLILERYDALAETVANGTEYQTVLDPPPADPRCAHPESTRPEWA